MKYRFLERKHLNEIERYAALWEDQMPERNGVSFRLQYIHGQYRTVVLGYKAQSALVCTDVRSIIDFGPLAPSIVEAWQPTILDKYEPLLRNELTFNAPENVFKKMFAMIKDKSDISEVDFESFYFLIKQGKFSLNEKAKRNQHPPLVFNALKANNRITYKGNQLSLYIKKRSTAEDEELDLELGIDN